MKTLKLLGVFLLLVGGIFLALNWNSIFTSPQGSEFGEKDKPDKSYSEKFKAEEDSIHQQQERQRAIEEVIAQEEQARKEILELVNERNLQGCRNHPGRNRYLTEGERGAIEAILDMSKYNGVVLSKVEEYLDGKRFSNYEEIRDALKYILGIRQQEKQRAEEAIAQEKRAREEILELVNERKLLGCRNHSGWNRYLTQQERYAIEAILDMSKYKGIIRKGVEEYLKGKTFSNYEEIKEAQEEIWRIQHQEKQRAEAIDHEKKAREQARKVILELVNERELQSCRNHSGWKRYLTQEERYAIEAILDMSKYKGIERKRVKDYLEDKKFSNYEEIREAQENTWIIIEKNK